MKKNIKELREKYISNPPEGMTCLLYTSDAADD
mgnify:CR=1 FL=1